MEVDSIHPHPGKLLTHGCVISDFILKHLTPDVIRDHKLVLIHLGIGWLGLYSEFASIMSTAYPGHRIFLLDRKFDYMRAKQRLMDRYGTPVGSEKRAVAIVADYANDPDIGIHDIATLILRCNVPDCNPEVIKNHPKKTLT